jgi:hypothetical protein
MDYIACYNEACLAFLVNVGRLAIRDMDRTVAVGIVKDIIPASADQATE